MQYDGQECTNFEYDRGAATTSLIVEFAEGFPLCKVGEFIVAHGQESPNFGRAKFQTVEEYGNRREVEGHVTSSSDISKYHDAFIFEEFGAFIPKHGLVSKGPVTRVSSTV